jgi:hypothetical protein
VTTRSLLISVWAKIEATLSNSSTSRPPVDTWSQGPPALQETNLIETTPLLPAPVKLKLKTPKSVLIDTSSQIVAPMGPPPVPLNRNKPVPVSADTRKRKPTSGDLDDLLGAEVDAMDQSHHSDSFEQMLEPKLKKQKLPKPSPDLVIPKTEVSGKAAGRAPSPEKRTKQKEPKVGPSLLAEPALPSIPPVVTTHYVPPQPPPDLPPTSANSMLIKLRRARHLISTLQKVPEAGWVSGVQNHS